MFIRYTQDCMEGSKKRLFVLSLHKYNKENHDNVFDSVHKSYTQVSSTSKALVGEKVWPRKLILWYTFIEIVNKWMTCHLWHKYPCGYPKEIVYALLHHQSFLDN